MASSKATDPTPLLQRAAAALQAGDLVTAERACRTALKALPNHPGGLHLLGLTARRAGHRNAALDLFRKAVGVAPAYAEAWVNLGRTLLDGAEADEARQSFERALQARAHFLPAKLGLAQALKAAGQQASARETLVAAGRAHPNAALPHLDLANLLQEQGEHAAAIAAYDAALQRDASLTSALSNRAAARLKTGDAAGALADADAYLARGLRSANVIAYRVLALQLLGREEEAAKWADPNTMVFAAYPEFLPTFAKRFEADIRAHPTLTEAWDPTRRAARGGKVTAELMSHPTPAIEAFHAAVRTEVDRLINRLPARPGLPFFDAKPARYTLTIWANILSTGGQQAAHIHNHGWASGVYYPSLPPEISAQDTAGWIAFGEPGYGLPVPLGLSPRLLRPQAGMMLIFPSYLWHHTVPLDTTTDRVSVAFDVVPAA